MSSGVREIQPLEQKCLLSGSTVTQFDEAFQPFIITDSSGNIQYNALGSQDLSSLSPEQQQQLLYGPWQSDSSWLLSPPVDGDLNSGTMGIDSYDDVGDYGFGADYGIDHTEGGGGIIPVDGDTMGDDYGYDIFGIGDMPLPDGGTDSATDSGDGAETGTGVDGQMDGEIEVSFKSVAPLFYEGPFSKREIDRAKIELIRKDVDGDGFIEGATATVEFPDNSIPKVPFARLGADFFVITETGAPVAPTLGKNGHAAVDLPLVSPNGIDTFYLVSRMDSDYEVSERIELKISKAFIHSTMGKARIGTPDKGVTMLADGSGDIDIRLLDEELEDSPGADIVVNNDDDNSNQISDLNDRPIDLKDDDLAPITLRKMLEGPNDWDRVTVNGSEVPAVTYFTLLFPANVRLYLTNGATVERGVTRFSDDRDTSLFIEGIAVGRGLVTLQWEVRPQIRHDDYISEGDVVFSHAFDTVAFAVRSADLDIDSDNDQSLAAPARTAWEDELEAHEYGIGKIIYPHPNPSTNQQVFTPIVVDNGVLPGDDPKSMGLQFDFPLEQGQSGYIKLWTVPSTFAGRIDLGIESGGHRISPGRRYSAEELAGINTLWVQAIVAQTSHNTRSGADRDKPDDRIKISVLRRNNPSAEWNVIEGLTDEVKYMVNLNDDVFYPNLQFDHSARYWKRPFNHTGIVLRDSLAAEGVYDSLDFPQFGLEILDGNQMRALGLSNEFVVQIEQSQANWSTGLRVGIYRDYLSPGGRGYILAFAGTQLEAADIIADLTQGLGEEGTSSQLGYQPQYNHAMKIARDFARASADRQLSPRTTGHSLGGGLATAASVAAASPLPATLFNAAGLHRNTLMQRSNSGNLTNVEKYDGSINRFETGANIVNYFTEFDPLTFLQNNMPALPYLGTAPRAIGKQVQLQAPYDGVVKAKADALRAFLNRPGFPEKQEGEPYLVWWVRFEDWLSELQGYITNNAWSMVSHHKMRFVQYGLMVHQADLPANPNSRRRIWDIFGDSDPE